MLNVKDMESVIRGIGRDGDGDRDGNGDGSC